MSSKWTADALRARLRTASLLEAALPASSRAFAQHRIDMMAIAAAVDAGTMPPEAAITAYEATVERFMR
ncbi:hypothetical protein [Microbacterium sp. P04]|uniref:hypothetical protein n=1 Tax=Microbacterium sp. P04 TaxID=3366947 RepID=UPI003746839D